MLDVTTTDRVALYIDECFERLIGQVDGAGTGDDDDIHLGKAFLRSGFRQGRQAQIMPVLSSISAQAPTWTLKSVKFMEWRMGRRVMRRTMDTIEALGGMGLVYYLARERGNKDRGGG